MNAKWLLVGAVGLALLGAAAFAVASRRPLQVPWAKAEPAAQAATSQGVPRPLPSRSPEPTAPSSEQNIARASDFVRIKTTYQSYRTALATGNDAQADALLPVLLRDRKTALACAEDDFSRAQTAADQSLARKTLEALRR